MKVAINDERKTVVVREIERQKSNKDSDSGQSYNRAQQTKDYIHIPDPSDLLRVSFLLVKLEQGRYLYKEQCEKRTTLFSFVGCCCLLLRVESKELGLTDNSTALASFFYFVQLDAGQTVGRGPRSSVNFYTLSASGTKSQNLAKSGDTTTKSPQQKRNFGVRPYFSCAPMTRIRYNEHNIYDKKA